MIRRAIAVFVLGVALVPAAARLLPVGERPTLCDPTVHADGTPAPCLSPEEDAKLRGGR